MGLEPSFSRNTPAWPFAGNGLLPLEPSDPALAIPPGAFQLSPRDMRDPGSIAGIDPALRSPREDAAAATTTRAASPARKWPITVSVSCLLHAAVGMALLAAPAAWYASPVDQAEIAGSEQAGLMVTGNADSDQMSAGDVTQITLVPMVDAKPIETVEAEPVQPDSAVQAVEHVTAEAPTAETVEPVTDAPPERTPTETAQPEQPPTETPAPEILTARADPADTGDAVVQPSPRAEPVEPVEETQQAQPQPAETVEPDAVATPQVVAVLPEPRPSLQKSPEKKAEPARQPKDTAKPPEKNQEKPRKKKANAGAGGANQADSKRGVANGSAEGKAAIASSGGSLPGVGNAAVSNYPGKVAAKLRRVSRTISRAAQASARSNAQVSFVVGAGGDVRSVRLVKSSGSPGLDDEALSIIRRAAPFPPIPAGAGRSNWAFTLPIGPY